MPQQSASNQPNALLRPFRPDKAVGVVAQPRDLSPDVQRAEMARQIFLRHFDIGLIAAVVDGAAEQVFSRWTGQAQDARGFQPEARWRTIAAAEQMGDGHTNDRDAIGVAAVAWPASWIAILANLVIYRACDDGAD